MQFLNFGSHIASLLAGIPINVNVYVRFDILWICCFAMEKSMTFRKI